MVPTFHAVGGLVPVSDVGVRICGEPRHNLFQLRKVAKPQANDYHDLLFDHGDALSRLSAPPFPSDLQNIDAAAFGKLYTLNARAFSLLNLVCFSPGFQSSPRC